MAPVVRAESLTKRFGSLTAADDLTFELEPGAITGFPVFGCPYAEIRDPAPRDVA